MSIPPTDDLRFRTVRGVSVPSLLYGTAWKEDATAGLVARALGAGFRGFDTANQRRHYHEAGVGAALGAALRSGVVGRSELFVQTKFTHRDGQDHRLPYDERASLGDQVRQSFASSLEHLGVDRIDSYVLHGPTRRRGLGDDDVAAWRAMEELHQAGQTRLLGVSNVALDQLRDLCDLATVPPAMVQNRCYARTGWDREVRAFCRAHDLVYQGFSLLTANSRELASPKVKAIAARVGRPAAAVVFRFALQVGMVCLTGTTSEAHMRADLGACDFALDDAEVDRIESLSSE